MTGIDLNRAGTPLLEIVTEPDLRGAKEAVAYAQSAARAGASGSASATATCRKARSAATPTSRCARLATTKLGTRCEIKNLNSFRFMEQAIEFEARRQIEMLEDGGNDRAGNAPLRSRQERDALDALQGRRAGLPLLSGSRSAAAGDFGGGYRARCERRCRKLPDEIREELQSVYVGDTRCNHCGHHGLQRGWRTILQRALDRARAARCPSVVANLDRGAAVGAAESTKI